MPTTTIIVGLTQQSNLNTVLIDTTNPRRPFYKGFVNAAAQFNVGTHFTSGDDVEFVIKEATSIMWADTKEDGGAGVYASKAFTEAKTGGAGEAGYKITCLNCTGDLKLNIIGDVR